MDYIAAGFDPSAFWRLTPRQFDLHMQGAQARIERELDAMNRHAYSIAALSGAAFAGQLPKFEKAFGRKVQPGKPQSDASMEASLRVLAVAWGAVNAEL